MSGETEFLPGVQAQPERNGRRRRFLFLPKLLRQAASDTRLTGDSLEQAHRILIRWADLESSGKLATKKETTLQGEFLTEVFGEALGYVLFSENLPQWQLEPHRAVPGGEADCVIGRFAPTGGEAPRVVIELKGPKLNLDYSRSRGRTPVEQCWNYMNAVPCDWGIVCNYHTFRLYQRNKTPFAYELFTLQQLRDPPRFREFYAIFSRMGLLPILNGQKPRVQELLERTDARQQEISVQLYKDYHESRLELVKHLTGDPHGKSLDEAIHIAQKLLDRIVFIAFCEDRELLPADAIHRAYSNERGFERVTSPRWRNFLDLFESVDKGNDRHGISKFNGGLFAPDPAVDNLQLDDRWTEFFNDIGGYDFAEDVNVDVLGHIFEQSVADLEQLRSDPEAALARGKPAGRRKREGIYYTPPKITRFIVEHTIGELLDIRFKALAEQHGIDAQSPPPESQLANWVRYQQARLETLRSLRICDPACGSGAFLIQAYEYLDDRYDEVLLALGMTDETQRQRTLRTDILRENLFGVDRSEEAVEITRLALWIRTAQRGTSLADLTQNIQFGNSLVDDSAVDPQALDWTTAFPRVQSEAGRVGPARFDCIISNPPYIKLQNFRKRQPAVAAHLIQRYRSARSGNFDMYLPFIERGLDLLRPGGRLGFIAPNVWIKNEYGQSLRDLVTERRALHKFVDFKSHQVFPGATTYTALQFFSTDAAESVRVADAPTGDLESLAWFDVPYARFAPKAWTFVGDREQALMDKMRACSVPLSEAGEQIFQGLITSADRIYHLTRIRPRHYWSDSIDDEVQLEDDLMKPLVAGRNVRPYCAEPDDTYLLFPYDISESHGAPALIPIATLKRRYRHVHAYLLQNEKKLRGRESGKMDHDEWYGYVYPKNLDRHAQPKLMVPRLLMHLCAAPDPHGEFYLDNVDVGGVLLNKAWSVNFVCGLLNSSAVDYFWRRISKPFRGEYRSANKQFIAPLPIPKTKNQKPVADLAKRLAALHARRVAAMSAVHRRLAADLAPRELIATSPLPPPLPGKLREFDRTRVPLLIDELESFADRKLKPTERQSWDTYLTKQQHAVGLLADQIRDHQSDLDDCVFKLFGLADDEVRLIRQEHQGA